MNFATITIAAILFIWIGINAYKMIQNVINGRSIDGCDGDCSHCKECPHKIPTKKN
jgi:hypothetical protein